jgi:nitrous oxidase accessory protein NosD
MAAKSAADYLTKSEIESSYVAKNGTDSLMSADEHTKLSGIEAGAQVNVIETVKVNGKALTPDEYKAVDISVPTGALASKSAVGEDDLDSNLKGILDEKVNRSELATVATTGNVDDLIQTNGTYVVFNCGTASTVI